MKRYSDKWACTSVCPKCRKLYNYIQTGGDTRDSDKTPFCDRCNIKTILTDLTQVFVVIKQRNNELDSYIDDFLQQYYEQHPQAEKYTPSQSQYQTDNPVPKCPTCGSTNIRRINGTEKAFNAAMFGLLGNKRKCQFECQNPNCRYRW